MKRFLLIITLPAVMVCLTTAQEKRNDHYITNREPLIAQPYTALPLGAIKPAGMLLEMLEIQRDGLTGHMDSIYELVCGPTNGWLGGIGDGWERGPYWLDGLVPLAYLLDDEILKEKAQEWIEWSIKYQRDNGYFGPLPLPENAREIKGTQQGNREDWWPKMVMLKVFQQYYSATGDERIITLMDGYFRYQLKTLEQYPLGNWSYWGNRRGGDNLAVVYWLYNITGEAYLLELAELIHKQTYDWTGVFSGDMIRTLNPLPSLHCVNVAQGLKEPVIYYQQHPGEKYTKAVKQGLESLRATHGFVNGMYGGDELLHGNDPTQGSELCSAVEMMFSFESMIPVTGDVYYADYLEKICYNVLPTQHDDRFLRKQYFQQANQVLVTDEPRNFVHDNFGRTVYGVLTGYPCCVSNMHQAWPKFVQNLWYATSDNGIAAMVYGASEVTVTVSDGQMVRIKEQTDYPFRDKITFTFDLEKPVKFPFHLRIPEWCKNPQLYINEKSNEIDEEHNIVVLDRKWQKGDMVELILPMDIRISRWYENSAGIERGPLVYALRIEEKWKEVKTGQWQHSFYEVEPLSPWNYGIKMSILKEMAFEVVETAEVGEMPWNLENAPIMLKTRGNRIPEWTIQNNSAGKIPYRSRNPDKISEEIILIPYGCTTLRISQFPVVADR